MKVKLPSFTAICNKVLGLLIKIENYHFIFIAIQFTISLLTYFLK